MKYKQFDDPKQKFVDDPKLKFVDDIAPKIKFADDGGTVKHVDDVKMVGYDKQFDDDFVGGLGGGIRKRIDDVKMAGYDKQFGDEWADLGGMVDVGGGIGGGGGRRPFVLQTPHHSMAWAGDHGAEEADTDRLAGQYEAAISRLESARRRGERQLKALDRRLEHLQDEYDSLLEEAEEAGED